MPLLHWELATWKPDDPLHCSECGNELGEHYVFHRHEDGRHILCIERCGGSLVSTEEVRVLIVEQRYQRRLERHARAVARVVPERRRRQAKRVEPVVVEPVTFTVAELRLMDYADYLQTDHWQAIRKAALQRAGYRCQLCNTNGLLDVHHRTYARLGCEKPFDVTVLCRQCHGNFHDMRR